MDNFVEMHWCAAFIEDKFYLAHPLNIDKLLKLEAQIKLEKLKLELDEEDRDISINTEVQIGPMSIKSRECRTEVNELKALRMQIDSERQLREE